MTRLPRNPQLVGRRFGRMVAIEETKLGGNSAWVCRCDCGQTKAVRSGHLLSGATRSCGCLKRETSSAIRIQHGFARMGNVRREYRTWQNMKSRCDNPNVKEYQYYGGRGIKVCEHWRHSFVNFLHDMGIAPPGKSIERENNNGDYEPENCRWATPVEQSRNRRTTISLELNGESHVISEWAEIAGVREGRLRQRLNRGWSLVEALSRRKRVNQFE